MLVLAYVLLVIFTIIYTLPAGIQLYRDKTPTLDSGLLLLGGLNVFSGLAFVAIGYTIGILAIVVGIISINLGVILNEYGLNPDNPNLQAIALCAGTGTFSVGLLIIYL